ncbi:hypothetical protein McanMca71_002897 [Microsporum canis]|uniref:Uncharacterized protein n=1 Tax=Arthroderma otae (strain ATCC MYA-4605 / CBS 113480) TaxID=554155 RepID=C5FVH1_ARTOC|nr:uncharacterized protein MCYG_06724 [Microsporum canis CBS 113480]EEQ33905.1 predicted protein [Microsporum canis CBS 113480]
MAAALDPVSMVADLGFRSGMPKRPVNEQTVRWAIHAAEVILQHEVSPPTKQKIKDYTAHGHRWMSSVDRDTSPAVHMLLSDFIKQTVDTYFTTCHPEIHMIEKVSSIALKAAKLVDLEPGTRSGVYSMLFEYVDVMEPIHKILNCRKCFAPDAYNIGRPVKDDGKVFWPKVTQAILSDKNTRESLPLNYVPPGNHHGWDETCTPSFEEARRIRAWLRRTCDIVGWKVDDIEWQIINYASFYETPCGPRMSIRTGQWRQLGMHTVTTRECMSKMISNCSSPAQGSKVMAVCPYANRVLDLVEKKWFTSLKSPIGDALSDAAVSLHAAVDVKDSYTKGYCNKFRQVSLFDHSQLIITEPLMPSRPFGYGTKNKSLKQLMGDEKYSSGASGRPN